MTKYAAPWLLGEISLDSDALILRIVLPENKTLLSKASKSC